MEDNKQDNGPSGEYEEDPGQVYGSIGADVDEGEDQGTQQSKSGTNNTTRRKMKKKKKKLVRKPKKDAQLPQAVDYEVQPDSKNRGVNIHNFQKKVEQDNQEESKSSAQGEGESASAENGGAAVVKSRSKSKASKKSKSSLKSSKAKSKEKLSAAGASRNQETAEAQFKETLESFNQPQGRVATADPNATLDFGATANEFYKPAEQSVDPAEDEGDQTIEIKEKKDPKFVKLNESSGEGTPHADKLSRKAPADESPELTFANAQPSSPQTNQVELVKKSEDKLKPKAREQSPYARQQQEKIMRQSGEGKFQNRERAAYLERQSTAEKNPAGRDRSESSPDAAGISMQLTPAGGPENQLAPNRGGDLKKRKSSRQEVPEDSDSGEIELVGMEFQEHGGAESGQFAEFDHIIELELKDAKFFDQEDGEIKEHDTSLNRGRYSAFFQTTLNDRIYRSDNVTSNDEETYEIENTFHIDRVPQAIQTKGLGSHLFIEAYDHVSPKPAFIGYVEPISMQTAFKEFMEFTPGELSSEDGEIKKPELMPILNSNSVQIGEIALYYKIMKSQCQIARHHHNNPGKEITQKIEDINKHVVVNSKGVLDIMVVGQSPVMKKIQYQLNNSYTDYTYFQQKSKYKYVSPKKISEQRPQEKSRQESLQASSRGSIPEVRSIKSSKRSQASDSPDAAFFGKRSNASSRQHVPFIQLDNIEPNEMTQELEDEQSYHEELQQEYHGESECSQHHTQTHMSTRGKTKREESEKEQKEEQDVSDFGLSQGKGGGKKGASGKKVSMGKKDKNLPPISYIELQKHIIENHPCDPHTDKRFPLTTRLTVKDFLVRFTNVCFCYMIIEKYKIFKSFLKRKMNPSDGYFRKNKPESLKMIPTSEEDLSSEEDNPYAGGVTICSQTLSEGSVLYLQSMKTFSVMFFILTIINLPVLMVYKSNTVNNDYANLRKTFQYFTIGNLGQTDSKCDYSQVNFEKVDHELPRINLQCPDGHYIQGLKHFGFLYQKDKRFNANSHAASFCYKAEFPLEPNLRIKPGYKKGDALGPNAVQKNPNDVAQARRRMRLKEAEEEIPANMGYFIKVKEQKVVERSLAEEEEEEPEKTLEQLLAEQERIHKTCMKCLSAKDTDNKLQNAWCTDTGKSKEGSECCKVNPQSSSGSNCKHDHHRVSHWMCSQIPDKQSFVDFNAYYDNFRPPPELQKGLCPNHPKCGIERDHMYWFDEYKTITKEYTSSEYIGDDEQCSYWIKGPKTMTALDYVDIKFKNFGQTGEFGGLIDQATIYIMTEGPDGEVRYNQGMKIKPRDHLTYTFMLQAMQDYDVFMEEVNDVASGTEERQKQTQKAYLGYVGKEFNRKYDKRFKDFYKDIKNKSKAYDKNYTTKYQLMIVIDGKSYDMPTKDGKTMIKRANGSFMEMIVSLVEGYEKLGSNDADMKDYTDDILYKRLMLLQDSKTKAQRNKEKKDFHQFITDYNIDSICKVTKDGDKFNAKESMFSEEKHNDDFMKYFEAHCAYKNNCYLDMNRDIDLVFKPGTNENMIDKEVMFSMPEKLSDHCINRIQFLNVTSPQFVAIIGCQSDMVDFVFKDKLHKEHVGIMTVVIDMLSIMVIAKFIQQLDAINHELVGKIDRMTVQMKDFSIQINEIILDKYTQDPRVLKIKIWLHFHEEILRKERTIENPQELLDINLSLIQEKKLQQIFKMQAIQEEIMLIEHNIEAGVYKDRQIQGKLDFIKVLQTKNDKQKEIYKDLLNTGRDKFKVSTKKIKLSERLDEIQYVFIMFRNCKTTEVVLEAFKEEVWIEKFMKKICTSKKNQKAPDAAQILKTGGPHQQKIGVTSAIEPDEMIWENLMYNSKSQKNRRMVLYAVGVICLMLSFILTIQTGLVSDWIGNLVETKNCPIYFKEQDWDNEDYKKEALDDYQTEPRDYQLGLMGCYCSRHSGWYQPWQMITRTFMIPKYKGEKPVADYVCLKIHMMWLVEQFVNFMADTLSVFINSTLSGIFQWLGIYSKQHTRSEELKIQFTSIFTMEFMNIAMILLVQSLSIFKPFTDSFGLDLDQYDSFNPGWYMDTGSSICYIIFMSGVVSNFSDLNNFRTVLINRLKDRSFKQLKADPDDDDDDDCNTKANTQDELVAMYTGDEFECQGYISRMMSTIYLIMSFSSGMPVMYAIGFVYFTATYLTQKTLILVFYTTDRTQTRDIPHHAIKLMKMGLIMHMVGAAFMLTNPDPFQATPMTQYAKKFESKVEVCKGTNCDLYRGKQFKTISGKICLPWTDNKAQEYQESRIIEDYGLIRNYCRNPAPQSTAAVKQDTIWCFVKEFDEPQSCEPNENLDQKKIQQDLLNVQDELQHFNAIKNIDQIKDVYEESEENKAMMNTILKRFKFFHQQLLLIFLLVFAIFFLIGKSIFGLIAYIQSSIQNCIYKAKKLSNMTFKQLENDMMQNINKKSNESYNSDTSESDVDSDKLDELSDYEQKEYQKEIEDLTKTKIIENTSLIRETHKLAKQKEKDATTMQKFLACFKKAKTEEEIKEDLDAIKLKFQEEEEKIIFQEMQTKIKSIVLIYKEKGNQEFNQAENKEVNDKKNRIIEARRYIKQQRIDKNHKIRPDYSENVLQELDMYNLQMYYLRARKDIDDFLDIFNLEHYDKIDDTLLTPFGNHVMKEIFLEICFINRLRAEKVKKYYKWLVKRQRDMEKVIDSHFTLMRDPLVEKKRQQFEKDAKYRREQGFELSLKEQFKKKKEEQKQLKNLEKKLKVCNYDNKMELLADNFDLLIIADKTRKGNRTGEAQICRIRNSKTQSYFILDAPQFQVGREMFYDNWRHVRNFTIKREARENAVEGNKQDFSKIDWIDRDTRSKASQSYRKLYGDDGTSFNKEDMVSQSGKSRRSNNGQTPKSQSNSQAPSTFSKAQKKSQVAPDKSNQA